MSENPPALAPKKEVIAPSRDSIAGESAGEDAAGEHNYGDARLWLAARDPRCLFAYWEFRPDEHPDAVGADGRARFFLRILREGVVEAAVEIERGAGDMFIPAQSPDSAYSAELGFFAGGIWCFLARSGGTRTPPEIPAGQEPAVFATIPARISLGKLRDVLAHTALPGESPAVTAARIQGGAQQHAEWTPEHERLLAAILGADAAGGEPSANSLTLAQRIQRKLEAAAAAAAAPLAPLIAPEGESGASSSASGWPTSPTTQRQ